MRNQAITFGPLEMEILAHLRAATGSLGVQEIQESLAQAGQTLAYTTVMTVLGRLHDKGVLTRKKSGRQYRYALSRTAARAGTSVMDRVQRAIFGNERLQPIMSLLKRTDDLSAEELRELRAVIDAKLRAKQQTP